MSSAACSGADVYVAVRPSASPVAFRKKWVVGCEVVYIGKADNVQRRLKQRQTSVPVSRLGPGVGGICGS